MVFVFVFVTIILLDIDCCLCYTVDVVNFRRWRFDMAVSPVVSEAEVERFRVERAAEVEFLVKLTNLVRELATKVGPRNSMYASMTRFLKARV